MLKLRGYETSVLEEIIRYSTERHIDSSTGRNVVVGKHDNRITPVTVHATSRQQLKFRLKTGRFVHG